MAALPLVLALLLSAINCAFSKPACPILPIDRPIQQLCCCQPRFVNLVPRFFPGMGLDTSVIDNTCIVYQPSNDSCTDLIARVSWVFVNGSNFVVTFSVQSCTPGIITYTSPLQSYTDVIFDTDCTTDYELQTSEDSSYVVGETPFYGQFPLQYARILTKFGFNYQDYRILPMNLPSQCAYGP